MVLGGIDDFDFDFAFVRGVVPMNEYEWLIGHGINDSIASVIL
jgi:hypothetical protein